MYRVALCDAEKFEVLRKMKNRRKIDWKENVRCEKKREEFKAFCK